MFADVDLVWWQWLLVALVTFCAALLQGSIGFGYAVVSVPLLSLLDQRLVPVPQLLSGLLLALWAMRREWSHVDWRGAFWVFLGRLPGLAIGVYCVTLLSDRGLADVAIGVCVLLAVLLMSTRLAPKRSPAVDFFAGVLSSTTGYVSAIGGPPIALLMRNSGGPEIRATLGFLFSVGGALALGSRLLTGQMTELDAIVGALLVLPMALGMAVSRKAHNALQGPRMRVTVLLACAACAALLLGRGLFRLATAHG